MDSTSSSTVADFLIRTDSGSIILSQADLKIIQGLGLFSEKQKSKKEIDEENKKNYKDPIEKVNFNKGRLGWSTTVIWKDGTKTTVLCNKDDEFSQEVGIAMCFMKKSMGNKGNYNNIFRKYCVEDLTKKEIKG